MAGGGGKGGAKRPQTVTSETKLPEWVEQAGQQNLALANEIASRPYQAYGGERIAGFTGDQLAMQQGVRDMQGQYSGMFDQPLSVAGNAATYTPDQVAAGQFPGTNLSAYMNPYTQNVIDRSLSTLNDQRLQALNTNADSAISSGAFGGSRHGVMEGVTNAQSARAAGDLAANLYNQNFTNAQSLWQSDRDSALQASLANQNAGLQGNAQHLQAAGLLGSLATDKQTARANELSMLDTIGQQQQGMEQARLDNLYQNWLDAKNHDLEGLNIRSAALSNTPYGTSTTQVSKEEKQRGDPISGALGGASMGSSFGPWGAVIGGALGLANSFIKR